MRAAYAVAMTSVPCLGLPRIFLAAGVSTRLGCPVGVRSSGGAVLPLSSLLRKHGGPLGDRDITLRPPSNDQLRTGTDPGNPTV